MRLCVGFERSLACIGGGPLLYRLYKWHLYGNGQHYGQLCVSWAQEKTHTGSIYRNGRAREVRGKKAELARELNISRETLYQYLRHEESKTE
jgi:hypothetical protein